MKRALVLALLLVGCRTPLAPVAGHVDSYQRAIQFELIGETEHAVDAAFDAIAGDHESSATTTQAALELLTHRTTASLGPLEDLSLSSRMARPLAGRLEDLLIGSSGDKRMYLSLALFQLSNRTNTTLDASRKYIKCLDRVAMYGPMWSARGPESLATLGGSTDSDEVAHVRDRGCDLSLSLPSARTGSRRISGSYVTHQRGMLRVAWFATNAATLSVNRRVVSTRAFSAGPGTTLNVATMPVSSGKLGVDVVAWMGSASDKVSVFVWLNDQPLEPEASGLGDGRVEAQGGPVAGDERRPCEDDACLAVRAGALAFRDDARAVQALLADRASALPQTNPTIALSYVRALRRSRDLPKGEMLRAAGAIIEGVLKREPRSWEALATKGAITADMKGGAEGCRAALAEIASERADDPANAIVRLSSSSCWLTIGQPGRARQALSPLLRGTESFKLAEAQPFPRTPEERDAAVCMAKGNEACANLQREEGKWLDARRSLENERARRGAPAAFAGQVAELDCLLGREVRWDEIFPGERTLALSSCLGKRVVSAAMPDVPRSLLSVRRGDSALPFDGLAEKALAKSVANVGEATVVIEHQERYEVFAGILGFEIFDLRRLGGTTDVEQNAQADVPMIDGLVSSRTVRRRIFKRDGRIIEPNRTPEAAQAGADLVQLEAGDSVESVIAGFAVADARGYIAFDTPDLLGERTRVEHVRIEVRAPAAFRIRAHPSLGGPREVLVEDPKCVRDATVRDHGCEHSKQESTYEARNLGPRNIEWRGLLLDRPVSVLVTNDTWQGVGSRLASALVALDDKGDAEIRNLVAMSGAAKAKGSLQTTSMIVKYVGERLRVSSPWLLADSGFARTEGTLAQSARSMLLAREGSRTWVIHRALREVGIASEVVISEPEPVSVDKDPIVHPGRFTHPLLRATIDGKQVFIDADVSGAPLPLGHVSPELVERPMLHADGRIEKLSRGWVKIDRDEVHLKLRLLANGDAEGEVHLQVGGPPAQELDEALQRVVGEPRAYLFRSLVQAWVPGADIGSVSASRDGDRIVVNASVWAARYAEREGDSNRFRLPGIVPFHRVAPVTASTLIRTYGARSDRATALFIRDALQYHVVRDVEFPMSLTMGNKVDDAEIREDHLVALRHATSAPHGVHDELTFDLRPNVIAPDQFAAFLKLSRRVDELFLASHLLLPIASAKLEAPAPIQVR